MTASERIPEFQSIEEEAEFWDTHSLADYWDEFEDEELIPDPQEDTCPRCGGQMHLEHLDARLIDNRVVLHRVEIYRCPTPGCGETKLSERGKTELAEIVTFLREHDIESLVLAAAKAA